MRDLFAIAKFLLQKMRDGKSHDMRCEKQYFHVTRTEKKLEAKTRIPMKSTTVTSSPYSALSPIATPPAKAANSALWYFRKFGFLAAVH